MDVVTCPVVVLHDLVFDVIVARDSLHYRSMNTLPHPVCVQHGGDRSVDVLDGSNPVIDIAQEVLRLMVGVAEEVLRLVDPMNYMFFG